MSNLQWGVGARSGASAIGTVLVLATGGSALTTGCWGPDHNRGVYVEPPRRSHEEHQEQHQEEHHEDHHDDHHHDEHHDDHGH
jgi:hypothetical protein